MADDANDTVADEATEADDAVVDAADEAADVDAPAEVTDEADVEGAEADEDEDDGEAEELPPPSEAKQKADAVIAARRAKDPTVAGQEKKVERRVVTSRRVTPKAGAKPATGKDAPAASESKARDAKKTEAVHARTSKAPQAQPVKIKGPSPWWVPALMFGLIIVGALVIMLNYMGVFGDPANTRLVIGLALILGGIIAATQYR